MTSSDTPGSPAEPTPHPLVSALAARLAPLAAPRVLLLGIGNGRNVTPLLAAGARLDAIEEDPARARASMQRFAGTGTVRITRAAYDGPYPFAGPFDGALSTHALLHGTPQHVAAALGAVYNRLAPNAPFFFTLGSKRDPRFGSGRSVAEDVYAPDAGSEAGVAHCYFDEPGVRALVAPFQLEHIEERTSSAGSWAHSPQEAASIVHWFVRARRA